MGLGVVPQTVSTLLGAFVLIRRLRPLHGSGATAFLGPLCRPADSTAFKAIKAYKAAGGGACRTSRAPVRTGDQIRLRLTPALLDRRPVEARPRRHIQVIAGGREAPTSAGKPDARHPPHVAPWAGDPSGRLRIRSAVEDDIALTPPLHAVALLAIAARVTGGQVCHVDRHPHLVLGHLDRLISGPEHE